MANIPTYIKRYNGTTWDVLQPIIDAAQITTGAFDTARIPSLDATKITTGVFDAARIPVIAITDVTTYTNEAALLTYYDGSNMQEGDLAVLTSDLKSYIHNGGSAGTIADFTLLPTPTDAVTSVVGQTGIVTVAQIRTAIGTGNNNLVPAVGTAGHFLKHDGTFGLPAYIANTNTTVMTSFTANNWKLFYSNGSGAVTELALAASGYLMSNGVGAAPSFEDIDLSSRAKIYYEDVDPAAGMVTGDFAYIY